MFLLDLCFTLFIIRPAPWAQDTVWLPAGNSLPNGTVIPSAMAFRSSFIDYLGAYVWHCHRLYHEDTGLMVLVNVIPKITVYALATNGDKACDSTVQVYNEKGTLIMLILYCNYTLESYS